MIKHASVSDRELVLLRREGKAVYGGNRKLKIYGTLGCKSGKRMKKVNRVFFGSAEEARQAGYRPCGCCMREAYRKWKIITSVSEPSPGR